MSVLLSDLKVWSLSLGSRLHTLHLPGSLMYDEGLDTEPQDKNDHRQHGRHRACTHQEVTRFTTLSRVHSRRTELNCLQCAHCSPAANQLRDADARDQERVA